MNKEQMLIILALAEHGAYGTPWALARGLSDGCNDVKISEALEEFRAFVDSSTYFAALPPIGDWG